MPQRLFPAGLSIALAFNLLLGALYLWGRAGQTSEVEVVVRGDRYSAFIDGQRALPAHTGSEEWFELDGPPRGSVAIIVPWGMPSLPGPRGVDAVRVTDAAGNVLLEDDFTFLDLERWTVTAGSFRVRDGVLIAAERSGPNILHLKGRQWTDYTISVTYRNGTGGVVGTRVTDSGDGVYYHFELQRDFPNYFNVQLDGASRGLAYGGLIQTSKADSLRSLAAMLAAFYPAFLALTAVGCAAAAILALLPPAGSRLRLAVPKALRLPRTKGVYAALGLAAAAFALTLYLNKEYYEFIPHVPDEVAYLFQAKLLAAGRFSGEVPPLKEAFYFYVPPFLAEYGDRWASFYPFGHPLVLALGELFGAARYVPSVLGAGSVLLLFLVARLMYGGATALVSAALFAASPFFLMQAGSFMSHNTAAFYMLLSLLFVLERRRPIVCGLLGGAAWGLLANTRPLTAMALVPPFGLLLLGSLLTPAQRRPAAQHLAAFAAAAALVGAGGYLLYNWAVTGDPLLSNYAGGTDPSGLIGFRDGHTLAVGLRNQQAQMAALVLVLHGWPLWAGLMFTCLPFLLGSRNRWDYFCLGSALLVTAAPILYRYSGVYEGPRYWYEAVPFLMLLAARGAALAADRLWEAALYLAHRVGAGGGERRLPAAAGVYAVLAVLVLQGSGGWLLGWSDTWRESDVPLVPQEPRAMRGLFGVDARLLRLAEGAGLKDALVLVKPCGFFQSLACYGPTFLENDIDFDGEVVWARYIPGRNAEIIAAFPGRTVYVATWDGVPSIRLYAAGDDP